MADRRPESSILVQASTALTTNGNTAGQHTPEQAQRLAIGINATAASGTPNVVFSVEWSHDGSTYLTADTADSMTAITAVGTAVKDFTVKGPYFRVKYVVTGGTPSLTTTITAFGV